MSEKVLPWVCESCGSKWVDSLFITWDNCPECQSEACGHESVRDLEKGDVWYE